MRDTLAIHATVDELAARNSYLVFDTELVFAQGGALHRLDPHVAFHHSPAMGRRGVADSSQGVGADIDSCLPGIHDLVLDTPNYRTAGVEWVSSVFAALRIGGDEGGGPMLLVGTRAKALIFWECVMRV